eukprot:4249128-Lingulodinium_polyedra.AAC.1
MHAFRNCCGALVMRMRFDIGCQAFGSARAGSKTRIASHGLITGASCRIVLLDCNLDAAVSHG